MSFTIDVHRHILRRKSPTDLPIRDLVDVPLSKNGQNIRKEGKDSAVF
jgi:hypothetical protein